MSNPNIFNKSVGLFKIGTIEKEYDEKTGNIYVKLHDAVSSSPNPPIPVNFPANLFGLNGVFLGTSPQPGTLVLLAQGPGNQHFFVSYLNRSAKLIPKLSVGDILVKTNDNTKISMDLKSNINIGSNNNKIHINTKSNLISSNFNNNYQFTQASRNIKGIVKRDLVQNVLIPQSLKLEDDIYDNIFSTIGMDPSSYVNATSLSSNKNPPFVECREIVYEFQYDSDVKNDLDESNIYRNQPIPDKGNFINRRQSRADTLSLTLLEPNYLIETIKGTVVDTFGNILDLNRLPLSIGQGENTIKSTQSKDIALSYLKIKELERKSIAYHFELNARKDLIDSKGEIVFPDINSNTDSARNRSRFYIDIDKEGQFKINVPSSSSKGNIPLLTRYENYASFHKDDDGNINPNKLISSPDNIDIFLDSFAAPFIDKWVSKDFSLKNRGSIIIKDNDTILTPNDRITETNIKHGTAHHDILSTSYAFIGDQFIQYQYSSSFPNIDVNRISAANEFLDKIVTDTININGKEDNAGGRSGSINLDGSLEFSIGANTIDRQSLWLDTAGGVIAHLGRDKNNTSLAMNVDGDTYIQFGGFGISTDSRFTKQHNGYYGATVDIRVLRQDNQATMIRIDNNGIQVMTPGFLQIHSSKGIKMTSSADISIDCETLTLQGRGVMKGSGGSI